MRTPSAKVITMSENGRWFMNAYLKILLAQSESAAGVSIIEHDMLGGFFVPPHVHHTEDETFYMLEGQVRFMMEGDIVEHVAGQSLHVPGGKRHALKVLSPRARFLTVTNGNFEAMVRAFSVPAKHPGMPPQVPMTTEDQQKLAMLCNRNGIEFVGPPID
jgi:quercetin dioxygenase-like cupin family protein